MAQSQCRGGSVAIQAALRRFRTVCIMQWYYYIEHMFDSVHDTRTRDAGISYPFIARDSRHDDRSVFPIIDGLTPFFPYGGMQRGSLVQVLSGGRGKGACPLAISLLTVASQEGAWCAITGRSDLGLLAVYELGVNLNRIAIIAPPASPLSDIWQAAAILLKGVDVVLLDLRLQDIRLQRHMNAIRRLAALARKYGSVCIVLSSGADTPMQERTSRGIGASVILKVASSSWLGPSRGYGHFHSRVALVESTGRGAAARPVEQELYLPGPDGTVTTIR